MGDQSNMPLLLIALGIVVILAIIVLLMKMRSKTSIFEEKAPTRSDRKSGQAPEQKEERKYTAPVLELEEVLPTVEKEKKHPPVREQNPSVELQTIEGPIEEAPGIDRDSFTKFAGKRVLVVEDNKINQKLILTLLNASKIDLPTAEDGIEALEKLRAPGEHFDLVLMDVNMPRMGGLEATREIRKDPRLKDIPVVALTASTTPEEVESILESGMNAYLDKPIVLGKLYRAFELFMNEYQRQKQAHPGTETVTSTAEGIDRERLDIETGLEHSNNDEALYAMLLEDFSVNYADSAQKISRWIEEKNYDAIRGLMIDLEGISGTLGAKRLYALTQKMHRILEEKSYDLLPDTLSEYTEELDRLKEEIERYLNLR